MPLQAHTGAVPSRDDDDLPPRPSLTATGARLLAREVERLRAQREDVRVMRLEELLHDAVVVEDDRDGRSDDDGDLVGIGSVAVVEDVASGRIARYELAGWHDGSSPRTVSAISPVGRALLGRTAGEHVAVELPDGRARELRVVDVEAAPRGNP